MEDKNHSYGCNLHEGGECNCYTTLKDLIEREKWHPTVHPTNVEMEASRTYNLLIERLIEKYGDYKVTPKEKLK